MDCTVHAVAKSQTQLSDFHFLSTKSAVAMFLRISNCTAGSWCCVLEFCFTVLYSFCKTGMAESYNQPVLVITAGAMSSCQLHYF